MQAKSTIRRAGLATFATAALLLQHAAGAAEIPKRGGTLRVAVNYEVSSLDPIMGNGPHWDRKWFNQIYESLIRQNGDGQFEPLLAESWTVADDNLSITFVLRQGVTFHDGTMLDAAAVKFNLDRLLDPASTAPAKQFTSDIDSIEVLADDTVRVNLARPSASVLSMLALEPGTIGSPTAIAMDAEAFARNPVGTGPFRFVSWSGGQMEVERFDGYWQNGEDGEPLPYLDGIVTRVIPNTAVKILELQSGNIDLGDDIQVKDFDQVESEPSLMTIPHLAGPTQYLAFNLTQPPFDDLDLRMAVAHAIDRDALERVISGGQGVAARGLMPRQSWAHAPDLPGHTLDLEKAKDHFARSGHSGPISLSIIMRDPDTQIAQVIQAMLSEAGIELEIEALELQAWLDKILNHGYQLAMLRSTLPRPDPDLSFRTYFGENARQDFAGINVGEVRNARLPEIVELAGSIFDVEKRKALYQEAQQIISDNYYYTYLFWRPIKDIASQRLHGVKRDYAGPWILTEAWLDD